MSPLRYAVAVTVLCPMMAVLGAKRPQDRAWQWVVVALLATLWLPAANAWMVGPGEPVHLSFAWQSFIAVLWLLGPLNYLPTRNWLPALVAATGQGVLLAPFLAPAGWSAGEFTTPASLAAYFVATGIVWLRAWRNGNWQSRLQPRPLDELNATWRHFRDGFGAFWAVRVMQRVNQRLGPTKPTVTLTWHGWQQSSAGDDDGTPDCKSPESQARRSMRTVLRRFVEDRT